MNFSSFLTLMPSASHTPTHLLIGRGPILQPPGNGTTALPNLKTNGAAYKGAVLFLLPSSYGISKVLTPDPFIKSLFVPNHSTFPPKSFTISRSASKFSILGTLSKTTSSLHKSAAGINFKIEFFEPEVLTVPTRGLPPSTKTFDIN